MKRSTFLSALLVGATAAAGPALAADDMPPEFRSSTFEVYVGAFGSADLLQSVSRDGSGVDDEALEVDLDGNAAGFGVRAGVDYVMDGWVVGALADWSFGTGVDIARDKASGAELAMPNLATIRARAGYTAGSALLYVTGGYAQAEMELSVDEAPLTGNDSDWTSGWTLGAGVDVAVTQQVTVGLEYLYFSLDDLEYTVGDGASSASYEHDLESLHTIRLGVNYAFQI